MHWRLWLGAALVPLVAAEKATYTLLHRVQSVRDDGSQSYTPWQLRALVQIPVTTTSEDLVVNEGIAAETTFPEKDTNAYYQVKLVEGDARTFSRDEWTGRVNVADGLVTFVKLVGVGLT